MSRVAGSLTPNTAASSSTAHHTSGNARSRHRRENPTYHSSPSPSDSGDRGRPSKRKRKGGRPRKLRWRRGLVTEAFRKFGEHCARGQIRTLLIDCLVMTNLFYPSLALYLEKKEPLSSTNSHPPPGHSFSPLGLDSLFPSPPPLLPPLDWVGWWPQGTSEWDDGGWASTQEIPGITDAGGGQDVWVMRVGWADVEDVLDRDVHMGEREWERRDHHLLNLVRDMAEGWESQYPSSGQQCLRGLSSNGSRSLCAIISPSKYIPEFDVTISPITDLANLGESEQTSGASNVYHSFAALFRVPAETNTTFASRWEEAVAGISREIEGEVFVEARSRHQPGEWYIYYSSPAPVSPQSASTPAMIPSSPPTIIIILYFVLFTTLIVQLSNASKVHSRFGLAFTGVVQLCCSSVMSFSVLALLGWNGWGASRGESSLPAYILPFVIVVVGAENMSTLTKAIFSIPFAHSVPVRIGLGLSKVGTTIALTSLTDLAILGIVWLCVNLQPVREFCLFAAVVIITDWFMLHTFFLTVLSIDAQRLELADVLVANKVGMASSVEEEKEKEAQNEGGLSWRKLLRARTTKSGSLLLLLFTVGLLYWLTEQHRVPFNTTASLYGYTPTVKATSTSYFPAPTPTPFQDLDNDATTLSSAEKLWRSINPDGWPFVHVVVPPASIVILPKDGHSLHPVDLRKLSLPARKLLIPRLKAIFHVFKVLILPQAITAGALYALLLYLLKDSELLDAQRDRLGRMDLDQGDETETPSSPKGSIGLAGQLKAYMLPCSHEADVDLISSNSSGSLVISVAIDNSICLWRFEDPQGGSGMRELLHAEGVKEEDVIVATTVSEDGHHVGVCTASGVLQIWEIPREGAVVPRQPFALPQGLTARVLDIAFDESDTTTDDPFTATQANSSSPRTFSVLVACADGSVLEVDEQSVHNAVDAQSDGSQHCRVQLVPAQNRGVNIIIAGQLGTTLWRKTSSSWTSALVSPGPLANDRITSLSHINASLPGVFAVGYRSGLVSIYDESHGQFDLVPQGASMKGVRKVELVRPASMKCVGCGLQSTEGYVVISSTATQVSLDRVAPKNPIPTFCRCPRKYTPTEDTPFGRGDLRKTSTLVVPPSGSRQRLTPGSSPAKQSILLTPVSNGEFPLSSHGSARRLSNLHKEDDPSRMTTTSPYSVSTPGSLNLNLTALTSATIEAASPGREMEITSLGGVSSSGSPSGGWSVVDDDVLVGIGRAREGINDDQWQVWAVDLTQPWDSNGLVVESVDLTELVKRTQLDSYHSLANGQRESLATPGMVSMQDKRTERLLSLSGRASFPSRSDSYSVPTYSQLGYVELTPMVKLGQKGMMGGFGNRMGCVTLARVDKERKSLNFGRRSLEMGIGIGRGSTPTARRGFALTPPPPPLKKVDGATNRGGDQPVGNTVKSW
ncbi:hypothetical protein I350_05252 [Cryptococcus amylolentus CBS 6273]|uniref:Sterol regulatory element-binding protein cleavage-activating protein n=1 Tax=Cryptococcus amylolentus CBS 6273 TaxID=1296118 RepID=A0A1E3JUZ0_9TREE|nr:hypothetical protein I350_05252 [Cryptococcus amylolentus CBS 6273]